MTLGAAASVGRLARRELLRHPWRTALLAGLVALPLAGVTLAVIAIRSTTWTRDDARTALLGRADDVVDLAEPDGIGSGAFRSSLADAYPAGSRIVVYRAAPDGLEGDDGHLHGVETTDQPLDDPLFAGTLDLVDGRRPRRRGEVAATRAALAAAGASIGDSLTLVSGRATVTGELVDPADPDRMLLVGTTVPSPAPASFHAVVDAPAGFVRADQHVLDDLGAWSAAPTGDAFDHLDGDFRYRLLRTGVAGGVVLAIATIVASAGFAIGARQQLHGLGLLAASGVPPRSLQAIVVVQGVLTGVLGATVGIGLGVIGALSQDDLVADLAGRTPGGIDVLPLDLVVVAAWGVVVPTVAAWLPARSTSRVPVLAALADRRPQAQLSRRLPFSGAGLAGAGLVGLTVWAHNQQRGWGYGLAAGLAVMLGAVAFTPWLVVQIERLARRSHGGARFAVRDVARQRLRSSAAVAAIAAPAALSVLAATLDRTDEARRAREAYEATMGADEVLLVQLDDRPDQLAAYRRRLDDVLPGATVVTVDRTPARLVGPERRNVVVISAEALASLGAPPRTRRAHEEGGIILFSPLASRAALRLVDVGPAAPADPEVLIDAATHVPRGRGIAAISPETAARWSLVRRPYALVIRAPAALTEAEREAVDAMVTTRCDTPVGPDCDDEDLRATLLGDPTDRVWLEIGRDHLADDRRSPLPLDAVGLSLVFLLAVTAAVLALTTTMDARQRALLDSLGVPPRARRAIALWHALVLTLTAVGFAIPAGLAIADAIVSRPHATGVGLQPPWPVLAILVLAVPAAAGSAAWLLTALADRRRPADAHLPLEVW